CLSQQSRGGKPTQSALFSFSGGAFAEASGAALASWRAPQDPSPLLCTHLRDSPAAPLSVIVRIMWYRTLRPALFALEPERAHRLALQAFRLSARRGPRIRGGAAPVKCLGLRFPNRVGLAAGFDKNAIALEGLGSLGFGFIEVGTVTPRAQPGQPPPRLFRLPAAMALINRLGFPNDGAEAVAARLRHRRYRGVVGVNIGKNASTPLERGVDDYVSCLR